MSFVILTRAGFDDIVARVDSSSTVFHLNPGIASADEIARLRAAGTDVHVLASPAGPEVTPELEHVLSAEGAQDEPLWIEGPLAASPADTAEPAHTREVDARPSRALRYRVAKTAGRVADFALRRIRSSAVGTSLMIIPYIGFGNAQRMWVKGRVLNERNFREQTGQDSRLSNLFALYQRLESDQIANALVRAHFQGQVHETVTDRGGYFSFEIATREPLHGGTHTVELEIPDQRSLDGQTVRATADVIVPSATARFGIISDIDDTVLWSNVTNKLNMALLLTRSNAHTRKPFKGVAAFYRALKLGSGGNEENPVFYVSSSPWHLFGPLVEFMRVQGIPVGPLLLRELGMRELFTLTNHKNHKLEKIELILSFYPNMQFVLIGDSGEQDPEIYAEVLRRHPASVRMIYIRNVNPDPSRIEALDRLIEEVSATSTQLVLVPDSVFAAAHAAAEGLIQAEQLAFVRSDKKEDDKVS